MGRAVPQVEGTGKNKGGAAKGKGIPASGSHVINFPVICSINTVRNLLNIGKGRLCRRYW